MVVTKNIALGSDYLKKLSPYIDKHDGNLSAAIRELIDNVGKSVIPDNTACISKPLFNWLINEMDGRLIPYEILSVLIPPYLICKLDQLNVYINKTLKELNWDAYVKIDYDSEPPTNISFVVNGNLPKIKIISLMLSQFIVQNSSETHPFAVKSIMNNDNNIKVELFKTSNKKDGLKSLDIFFGRMEETMKNLREHNSFWKCIIHRHSISNYQMVTIHKNYYEDIMSGKIPMGEIMIEILAKKPIHDIQLKELLPLVKQVYEVSGVVDRVEIKNSDMILFHSYRNKDAIERIKKSLIMLLETSGHIYDGKITTNMIVLSHRPDVGMKINEIVNNLKVSNSKLDHELITFLSYLKDLKNISDTPMSVSVLGRRIGVSLIQEYEKENNIKQWDLTNFKTAFTLIDSKIHRDSDWKLDGDILLYRIKKCDICMDGDTIDAYVCRAAREAFKGALHHAFGSRAEMEIKRLRTHGDNYCEVSIKLYSKTKD